MHRGQEQSAYNGYFESVCDPPLFGFNQDGDRLAAKFPKPLPALTVHGNTSSLTAIGNDYGYDQVFVFAREVGARGHEGDVLLAISTSGNSPSILRAIEAACEKRMAVIGLTGERGGKMRDLCDVCLCVPSTLLRRAGFSTSRIAPRRSFFATERYDRPEPVNVGSGCEISIKELVDLIAAQTGFHGKLGWDSTKPNSQPRGCLDTTRAWELFGFRATTDFREGLCRTLEWFSNQ